MDQVATLQMNMQQMEASFSKREKDWQMEQARVVALQTHDATHAKETIQALETKSVTTLSELSVPINLLVSTGAVQVLHIVAKASGKRTETHCIPSLCRLTRGVARSFTTDCDSLSAAIPLG
ncbi:Aste57867_4721 [Aphanomyces stellatus]|uniref:Aste57867_4721 protein n=1 Tax=Aphanomyces stellatus TaxID=120398 RepID=A0A485KH02_9STRA|nr:hypothetical protein As57867_004708 [Aphanomyces stellatus]VFT81820.1 Aste57867_4721 [Aphanomyces stellatus]